LAGGSSAAGGTPRGSARVERPSARMSRARSTGGSVAASGEGAGARVTGGAGDDGGADVVTTGGALQRGKTMKTTAATPRSPATATAAAGEGPGEARPGRCSDCVVKEGSGLGGGRCHHDDGVGVGGRAGFERQDLPQQGAPGGELRLRGAGELELLAFHFHEQRRHVPVERVRQLLERRLVHALLLRLLEAGLQQ